MYLHTEPLCRPSARWQSTSSRQEGFTLVELLIVVIIIALLVLIALPAFVGQQDKAKEAVLDHYAHDVKLELDDLRLNGYSYEYVTSISNGRYRDGYLSCELEKSLELIQGSNYSSKMPFVNPYSQKRTIVNYGSLYRDTRYVPPAVWITNRNVAGISLADRKTYLPGTVIAQWVGNPTQRIDIYYVKGNGQLSSRVIRTPAN